MLVQPFLIVNVSSYTSPTSKPKDQSIERIVRQIFFLKPQSQTQKPIQTTSPSSPPHPPHHAVITSIALHCIHTITIKHTITTSENPCVTYSSPRGEVKIVEMMRNRAMRMRVGRMRSRMVRGVFLGGEERLCGGVVV